MPVVISIIFSVSVLGFLTAISPCPLATNIAAISYISQNNKQSKTAIFSSILYAFGRTITYLILSLIITTGLLSSAVISQFLQKYMNEMLGPILILVGLILLKMINLNIRYKLNTQKFQSLAKNGNLFATFFIGVLFALSFCPVSAGLFFGGLIPLILKHIQIGTANITPQITLPLIYGISTSIPVIFFGLLIAFSSQYVEKIFHNITKLEGIFRTLTGLIFIIVGIYYCLNYIFEAFV